MRLQPEPTVATWLLKLFCSSAESESVIGDLLEQYHLGRSRFWYWRQVIAIVFLSLRHHVTTNGIAIRQATTVVLVIVVLSALLLTDISLLFLGAILGGVITGILMFFLGNGLIGPSKGDTSELTRVHPGISMHH